MKPESLTAKLPLGAMLDEIAKMSENGKDTYRKVYSSDAEINASLEAIRGVQYLENKDIQIIHALIAALKVADEGLGFYEDMGYDYSKAALKAKAKIAEILKGIK